MNGRANWVTAAGIGAGLAYLFDPQTGSRRRALLRDKLTHVFHKGSDAVQTTSRDLTHRLQGLTAETKARLRPEEVEDDRLVERVRSKLGRHVSHPRAIEVEARDGRVTLRGPVLAHEAPRLVAAVRRVRGVRDVDDRLETHTRQENVPALQGGATPPGEPYEIMQRHWAPATRLMAGLCGGGLAAYGLARRSAPALALGATGVGLVGRALTNLEIRRLVGLGGGRRAVDLQKTLTIDAPASVVYRFWADLRNLPRFMAHVKSVRPTDVKGQTRWTVDGPGGLPVEFDAIVTEAIPDRLVAWKTVEGSPVSHAGTVRFDPEPGGRTRMQVRMSYNPPAGAVGHAVASLLGADPRSRMHEDLLRMKTLLETGNAPHDAAVPQAPVSGEARRRL